MNHIFQTQYFSIAVAVTYSDSDAKCMFGCLNLLDVTYGRILAKSKN